MSHLFLRSSHWRRAPVYFMLLALAGTTARQAAAQMPQPQPQNPTTVNTGNIVNIVGGVRVDAGGVLSNIDDHDRAALLEARSKAMQPATGDMNQPAKLRMVSLRQLDDAIAACSEAGKPLPDEIKYLAGLQRVQYVFVYPEQKDIVLAGPAEGWKLNAQGNVVGTVSGRPVMQLDDLLVALRCADAARQGGISVSIDPTAEGIQRLKAFVDKQAVMGNPEATTASMEQALGPQTITLRGVPTTSRFAAVLTAADYRMKRIAMDFEPAPVKGMPSYLALIPAGTKGMSNMMPRWWLAPNYGPVSTDGKGLAWELKGPGVKCMAQEDFFNSLGQRQESMKANPASQKWAENMTAHYEELSEKDAVFGDLRNCMDLAVVGALVLKENLFDKIDFHPLVLLNDKLLQTAAYNSPSHVDSRASFVKKGRNYVISTSGGVDLQPWEVLQKTETSPTTTQARTAALKDHGNRWWWN
ncbi:MAG TPA: DUF1598 domain-containing protein [Pirellulales bacterium]